MHEPVEHTKTPIGSERSFAVVFTIVFTLVALRPLLDDGPIRRWAILVAVAILLVGIAAPHVFVVPNRLWCRLGIALGSVTSQVVMVALFFLVLTPTGLAMRLFGKVPKEHGRLPDAAMSTYWIRRGKHENPMGSLRNQY